MRDLQLDIGFAHRSAELAMQSHQCLSEVGSTTSIVGALKALADSIDSHLKLCGSDTNPSTWNVVANSARALACHLECQKIARDGSDGLSEMRQRLAVLVQAARETILGLPVNPVRDSLLLHLGKGNEIADAKQFTIDLCALPLPVTYLMKNEDVYGARATAEPAAVQVREPSVIKVIAFLDGAPLVSPQLVRKDTLYTLKFCVRGEAWPPNATRLSLDLLTTCPSGTYEVSGFTLPRPQRLEQYEGELPGEIVFKAPQSVLAENLVFTVRCAFQGEKSDNIPVPTIGHNEVQFRVDSPDSALLASGYRNMDLHVSELIRDLLKQCPSVQSELAELMPLLGSLVAFLGACAQGGIFKGVSKLSESEFQKESVNFLRMRLGQDIQEHPHQAGGITDVRFRGVVTELKVERKNGDRNVIAQSYCPQGTQYQGVEARQVSVALILDLTPKVLPPGDIRNDIMLVDVATHGGPDNKKKYPSKAFVFVINGNTADPSSYSP
jgi:hypothetical protein